MQCILCDMIHIVSDWVFPYVSIEAAVAAFAQARSPGIYKGDYLKELFRRYGDVEDAPAAPALPEWCFDDDEDEDVDDDGNAIAQGSEPSSSQSSQGKKKKERLKVVRKTHFSSFFHWYIPGSIQHSSSGILIRLTESRLYVTWNAFFFVFRASASFPFELLVMRCVVSV